MLCPLLQDLGPVSSPFGASVFSLMKWADGGVECAEQHKAPRAVHWRF